MKNEELESPRHDIQQRTFAFACRVVRLHVYLQRRGGAARILANQLVRSATSIGANLEEATVGQSKADFISKCTIALKEARETHYWLRLFSATELVPEHQLRELTIEANEIVAILMSIVRNARSNRA